MKGRISIIRIRVLLSAITNKTFNFGSSSGADYSALIVIFSDPDYTVLNFKSVFFRFRLWYNSSWYWSDTDYNTVQWISFEVFQVPIMMDLNLIFFQVPIMVNNILYIFQVPIMVNNILYIF